MGDSANRQWGGPAAPEPAGSHLVGGFQMAPMRGRRACAWPQKDHSAAHMQLFECNLVQGAQSVTRQLFEHLPAHSLRRPAARPAARCYRRVAAPQSAPKQAATELRAFARDMQLGPPPRHQVQCACRRSSGQLDATFAVAAAPNAQSALRYALLSRA